MSRTAALTERELQIVGYPLTWGTLTAGATKDGAPCWFGYVRGAFDRDLAQRSSDESCGRGEGAIRFVIGHDTTLDLGWWGPFMNDATGLKGLAVLDDSPAARDLLEAIHDGRCTHLSHHAEPIRSKVRGRPGPNGWPVYDIEEARLVEAGPCDDPADDLAVILEVGGQEPQWRSMVERSEVIRNLRSVPAVNY